MHRLETVSDALSTWASPRLTRSKKQSEDQVEVRAKPVHTVEIVMQSSAISVLDI